MATIYISQTNDPLDEAEREHIENLKALAGLFIIFGLVGSHYGISYWKRSSPSSYHLATLLGLWWIPFLMGLNAGNYRFVIIHLIFSLLNSMVIKMAWQVPLKPATPKWVYAWYSWVYSISVAVGGLGLFLMLFSLFHIPGLLIGATEKTELTIFGGGIITFFYGIYFGTLGRDFVDRLSVHMATSIGYYSANGFPSRVIKDGHCAICGESTYDSAKTVLECSHSFHPICIRGWTVIGKKDMCPCCKEKVDLKEFQKNPWGTSSLLIIRHCTNFLFIFFGCSTIFTSLESYHYFWAAFFHCFSRIAH
jgi:RING finger protein 121